MDHFCYSHYPSIGQHRPRGFPQHFPRHNNLSLFYKFKKKNTLKRKSIKEWFFFPLLAYWAWINLRTQWKKIHSLFFSCLCHLASKKWDGISRNGLISLYTLLIEFGLVITTWLYQFIYRWSLFPNTNMFPPMCIPLSSANILTKAISTLETLQEALYFFSVSQLPMCPTTHLGNILLYTKPLIEMTEFYYFSSWRSPSNPNNPDFAITSASFGHVHPFLKG